MFAKPQVQYSRLANLFDRAGLDIVTFPWDHVVVAGGYLAGIREKDFGIKVYQNSDLDLFIYGVANRLEEMQVVANLLQHMQVTQIELSSKGSVCNVQLNDIHIQIILRDGWDVHTKIPEFDLAPSTAETVLDTFDMFDKFLMLT